MTSRPRKILIFGLDGPVAPALLRYCREGKLPAMAKLIDNGVLAPNAMVPLPTATPANWASIGTGAWPSTHGISDYNVHVPGDPLDVSHMAFHSPDVKAEYIWNSIERAGKKSIVVNFVTTWPPTVKNGIQIGGPGCDVNQWFHPNLATANRPAGTSEESVKLDETGLGTGEAAPALYADCANPGLFCTDSFKPESTTPVRIKLHEPTGWTTLPKAVKVLEADLILRPAGNWHKITPPTWQMLVLDSEGKGFDRVQVYDRKNAAKPLADLKLGKWSPVLELNLETAAGNRRCAYAMKLLGLSADASDVRLYHTCLCALDGWSQPTSVAAEISSPQGLPNPDTHYGYYQGWFGADTLLEEIELQRKWYADACTYLLKNKPWDLFIMRYHLPDTSWHAVAHVLDPTTAKSAEERKEHEALELGIYEACDRLAADLIACVDQKETLIALISDHGAKPNGHPGINANAILESAGLLVRDAARKVDWSKTKAIARPVCWVHIALEGRDPGGVVRPGAEYREVQDRIIQALTDYVEPTTKRKPVLFAFRKEDARFLNIYGDHVGDVVYALKEDFGGQHGPFLATADYQGGSMRGLFALSGPGVRKGVQIERNVWCIDLVPTLCHIAGWPVPRDANGSVIYQAIDPALEQALHSTVDQTPAKRAAVA